MQRILSAIVSVVWGLWFGGIILLFIAVQSIFRTFTDRRELAGEAAAGIFHVFHHYQLALAAAALVASFGWRLSPGAARLKTALFSLFALATIGAVVLTAIITPKIDALQRQALTHSPAFRQLHGMSMAIYLADAAVLLIAGLLLPAIVRRDRQTADTLM